MSGNCPQVFTMVPQTFRQMFPAFANPNPGAYPDVILDMWFDNATSIMSADNWGALRDNKRQNALYFLTAHLMQLAKNAAENEGSTTGIVTEASVDKIRVSIQPPPNTSQLQWWLNQTNYGSTLYQMLSAATVGGFYAGGSPELSAFRRVGGFSKFGFR